MTDKTYTVDDFTDEQLRGGRVAAIALPGLGLSATFAKLDELTARIATSLARDGWSPVRECPDPEQHAEVNAALAQMAKDFRVVQAQRDDAGKRASKAERERDEARATKDMHKRRADEERARAEAAESRPLTPDTMTAREYLDAAWEAAYEPECGNVPKGACFLTKSATGVHVRVATEAFGAHGVRLLDSPTPARPDWLDAPAVRAWHKNDGRTEHDGTPGVKRIWSPDYGTTDTWSTPSLRNVPWEDLVDVEPLDVSAELAEGLDRVAAFMSTGMVRVVDEERS